MHPSGEREKCLEYEYEFEKFGDFSNSCRKLRSC